MQAIGDVVIGSVLPLSGQRANECRIAMFLAGFPNTVPVHTVNRHGQLYWLQQLTGCTRLHQHCTADSSAAFEMLWPGASCKSS